MTDKKFKTPTYVMIHNTAISHEKNPDQFKATNSYHQAQWNFKSSLGFYVGYNYEINKAGRAHKAREDGETTAACYQKDMNDGRCIHIALDGNFDIEKPSPNQIYKLRDLLKEKCEAYKIPVENIVFHNQYAPKSCPGKNMELTFVRSLVRPEVVNQPSDPDAKNNIVKTLEYLIKLVKEL